MRHATDGNAAALDRHFDQPQPGDFTECTICGLEFGQVDEDGETVEQSRTDWERCALHERDPGDL